MSLAEEMLATMPLSDDSSTYSADEEPHIVINESRQAIVPNELKTIAVTGDKDIETVTFDCVRYWDGNDLSTFAIYLNYVLPDLTTGTYIPEKITTTDGDEFYHFDWQIKNNITAKSGKISFAVTAISTKPNLAGTPIVDKQWSSLPNSDCSIALGIDISNVPSEEESSAVLAQMSAILEQIQQDFDKWLKNNLLISQTTGYSETAVMSQKATTDAIGEANETLAIQMENVADTLTDVLAGKGIIRTLQRTYFGEYAIVGDGSLIEYLGNRAFLFVVNGAEIVRFDNADTVAYYSERPVPFETVSVDGIWHTFVGGQDLTIPAGTNYIVVSNDTEDVRGFVIGETVTDELQRTEAQYVSEYEGFTLIDGGYIRQYGDVVSTEGFVHSDYIEADKFNAIYCSIYNNAVCVAFYDMNKNFISVLETEGADYTPKWYYFMPPKKARFIRFSNRTMTLPNEKIRCLKYDNEYIAEKISRVNSTVESLKCDIIGMYDKSIHIGDSITWSQVYYGEGAEEQRQAYKTYPSIFAKLCGIESTFFATPGATPQTWWNAYSLQAFNENGLYIVFLGTNAGLTDTISADCPNSTDVSTYADTNTGCYGKILQTITNNGDKAVLVKPYIGGGNLDVTNNVIEQFGNRYNFPVISVDEDGDLIDINYHLYPDGSGDNMVHFNDLGYAWLANTIRNKINGLSTADKFKIMRAH